MLKSNNEANNGFVSRAKKQAKAALKLSKNQNGIVSISNLSQSQEFIANINGFPSWYALQENTSEIDSPDLNTFNFTFLNKENKPLVFPLFDGNCGRNIFINSFPGNHSSYFYNTFLLENFLDKKPRNMIKTVLLNAGRLSSVSYLESSLSKNGVMLSCCSKNFHCNFMAFPFGKFKYTQEHRGVLSGILEDFFNLMKPISGNQNKYSVSLYVKDLLDFVESENFSRDYVSGFNYELDLFVEKNKITKKSWREICEILLDKNEISLAKIAHAQSCACFRDLYSFNFNNDLKKYGFDDDVQLNINRNLEVFSLYYPNLTFREQTDLSEVKLLVIDCEDTILKQNSILPTEQIGLFMNALFLSLNVCFFEDEKLTGVQNKKSGVFFNHILTYHPNKNLIVDMFNSNEKISKIHFLQNAYNQHIRLPHSFMIHNCVDMHSDFNLPKELRSSIERGDWLLCSPDDNCLFKIEIGEKYNRVIAAEREKYKYKIEIKHNN